MEIKENLSIQRLKSVPNQPSNHSTLSTLSTQSPFLSFQNFWKTNSRNHFPYCFKENNITANSVSTDEAFEFIRANFSLIYGSSAQDNSRFLFLDISENKKHYYEKFGDFIGFFHEDKIIGLYIGTLMDWSTYYIRSISIHPDYQGQKIFQNFLNYYMPCLALYGVERVESDISPNNLGQVHLYNKLGFLITGINNSERWGSLVRFTKYLCTKHQAVFTQQFCSHVDTDKSNERRISK